MSIIESTQVEAAINGEAKSITVSKLKIKPLYQWIKFLGTDDTVGMVAMTTGLSREQIDEMEPGEFAKLAKASFEVNFPRAVELAKGDIQAAAAVAPILEKAVTMSNLTKLLSSDLSPELLSSASVAATSNASSTS